MEVSQLERERLQSLHRYRILDTPPEAGYDRFTRLATQIFRAPISSITFADADRLWVKSCIGTEPSDLPRETALCNYVVARGGPLVIEDALKDPEFAAHPFVTDAPYLRFYAGVPLRSRDGFCLGVLSVSDREPRRFGEADLDILVSLSEQVQEELDLRRQRDQYQFLFEGNPHPMWIYNADSLSFLAVNQAATAKYGYSQDEFLRMRITDLRPAEEVPFLIETLSRSPETQRFSRQVLHRTKDGTPIYSEITSSPVEFEGRNARFVLAVDVTERTRAEKALQVAESRFRMLAENAVSAIYIIQDDRFVYVNPRFEEISGYTLDELSRSAPRLLVYEEDRALVAENIRKRLDREVHEVRYEFRLLRKDGQIRYVETHGKAIEHDGRPAVLGTIIDVTDRVFTEAALKRNEARFRALIHNSAEIITLLSPDGTVQYQSPSISRILGYTPEELEGTNAFDLIHPGDRGDVLGTFQQLLSTGGDAAAEFRFRSRDGAWRRMESTASNALHDPAVGALVVMSHDVTERRHAEDELRKSRTQYERLVNSLDGIVWEGTTDTRTGAVRFTFVSERLRSILGYSPESWLADPMHWVETLHEEDRPWVPGFCFDETRAGRDHAFEYRAIAADGRIVWLRDVVRIVDVQDGIATVAGVMIDVTESRHAQSELRNREELLRLATQAADIGIWNWDTAARQFQWDAATAAIFGLPEGERCGTLESLVETVYEPDRPIVARAIQEALKTRSLYTVDYRITHSDGTLHWIAARGRVYTDADGRPVRVTGTVKDITRRKATEQALQESEERLRLATEAGGVGTFDVDIARAAAEYSPRGREILGVHSEGPIPYENFLKLMHPDDLHLAHQAETDTLDSAGAGIMDVEHRIIRPDGEVRWIATRASVQFEKRDGHPRPVRMIGTLIDTTARKQAEAELIRAKVQAEEMARLKDTFLANMSHEIRTPLTAIIGFSEVLAEDFGGEENEIARMIHASGQRLLETLNSVLDLAQIESGSLQLKPEPVRLNEAVELAIDVFQHQAAQKGIYLKLVAPPEPIYVEADHGALGRILNNLISNALKFTSQGGVTVEVGREEHTAWIRVADTGMGISRMFLPHLFEEFRQESDGISRSHEGSGLGLTITKRLVEMMGGTIEAHSEKGRGSAFTVRLPSFMPGTAGEINEDRLGSQGTVQPRILVVEDQKQTQVLLGHFLKGRCELTTAYTAEEALELARTGQFDAVFLDINLSEAGSGIDVLHGLRRMDHLRRVPILACTAYGLPGDREKLLGEGFDGYLAKPFRKRDLLRALVGVLEYEEQ